MARLRTPRKASIQRYCAEKGWGPQELARHAAIAPTTAYKAFNGDQMFRCKLVRIANSLKKPLGLILDESDPEALSESDPPDKELVKPFTAEAPSFKLTLTIEGNSQLLSDSEIVARIQRFLALIGANSNHEPEDIQFGSVHITLCLYLERAIVAIDFLVQHALEEIGVKSITLHDPYPRLSIVSHVDLQNAYYSELHAINNEEPFGGPGRSPLDGISAARLTNIAVRHNRRFHKFNRFPMLYTVFAYFQAGMLEVDIVSPLEWVLKPTVSSPLYAPERVLQD